MFGTCLGDHLSAVALASVAGPVFHHLICRGRDAAKEVGWSILPPDGRAGSVATSSHPNPEHPPFAPADKPSISVTGCGTRFPVSLPTREPGMLSSSTSNNLVQHRPGWLNASLRDDSGPTGFDVAGPHLPTSIDNSEHAAW